MAFPEREQFVAFLRRERLRVTNERLVLVEEMYTQHGHLDAEALLKALRRRGVRMSRATVYRNLDLLVRCGLARRVPGQGRALYEHVHGGLDHDHLVCGTCGRVVEFVSPGITALQAEICRAHGFVPRRSSLHITGLCLGCAAAETRQPSAATA